jgi:hypothetical protein
MSNFWMKCETAARRYKLDAAELLFRAKWTKGDFEIGMLKFAHKTNDHGTHLVQLVERASRAGDPESAPGHQGSEGVLWVLACGISRVRQRRA